MPSGERGSSGPPGAITSLVDQQFPITFKLSGPAPNLGVRHGSVVAGARWGHSNTIQAAAWLVKLR